MSGVLCTFPGRYGDLLWALPTVRAISEFYNIPVDLLIAGEFAPLVPLLLQQPYLSSVAADPSWGIGEGWDCPMLKAEGDRWGRIHQLGYRRWPELPLPFETYERVASGWTGTLDLTRPWITAKPWTQVPHRLVMGWSDCHFELKVGVVTLLSTTWKHGTFTSFLMPPAGSRWCTEYGCEAVDWLEAARRIAACDVFLGDCSALHVLAVALGKPVVLMEPMEARWNDIFYPLGKTGRVRLVTGLDGKPTFDARHTADALKEALAHAR